MRQPFKRRNSAPGGLGDRGIKPDLQEVENVDHAVQRSEIPSEFVDAILKNKQFVELLRREEHSENQQEEQRVLGFTESTAEQLTPEQRLLVVDLWQKHYGKDDMLEYLNGVVNQKDEDLRVVAEIGQQLISENQELGNQVLGLKNIVTDLQNMMHESQSLNTENQILKSDQKNLLTESKSTEDGLRKEISQLTAQRDDFREKLQLSQQQQAKYTEDLNREHQKNQEFEDHFNKNQDLQQRLSKFEAKINGLTAKINGLTAENDDLAASNAKLQSLLSGEQEEARRIANKAKVGDTRLTEDVVRDLPQQNQQEIINDLQKQLSDERDLKSGELETLTTQNQRLLLQIAELTKSQPLVLDEKPLINDRTRIEFLEKNIDQLKAIKAKLPDQLRQELSVEDHESDFLQDSSEESLLEGHNKLLSKISKIVLKHPDLLLGTEAREIVKTYQASQHQILKSDTTDDKLKSMAGVNLIITQDFMQKVEESESEKLISGFMEAAKLLKIELDSLKSASSLGNPKTQTLPSTQEFFLQEYEEASKTGGSKPRIEQYKFVLDRIDEAQKQQNPEERRQALIGAANILNGYSHQSNIRPVIWKLVAERAQDDDNFKAILSLHAPEFCKKLVIYCSNNNPENAEVAKFNTELQGLISQQENHRSKIDQEVETLEEQNLALAEKNKQTEEKLQTLETDRALAVQTLQQAQQAILASGKSNQGLTSQLATQVGSEIVRTDQDDAASDQSDLSLQLFQGIKHQNLVPNIGLSEQRLYEATSNFVDYAHASTIDPKILMHQLALVTGVMREEGQDPLYVGRALIIILNNLPPEQQYRDSLIKLKPFADLLNDHNILPSNAIEYPKQTEKGLATDATDKFEQEQALSIIVRRDNKSIDTTIIGLDQAKDNLQKIDRFNLSIPELKGNRSPEEMKKEFANKATEIDTLKHLPIEFYDQGGVELQKQINAASNLKWDGGKTKGLDGKMHEALISYIFDSNNYRVIIAQKDRVSVNFVSYDYMKQQDDKIKLIHEARAKTAEASKGSSIDKGDSPEESLSVFYRKQEREIVTASKQVVINTEDTQEAILKKFNLPDGNNKKSLEDLISKPGPAPINLGSGYSIARQKDGDTNNIRITCIADESGNFKDNVIYANVTGSSLYVKVQVATRDDDTIAGKSCKDDGTPYKKGEIVILDGLYKEPGPDGKMTKQEEEKLSKADKDAVAKCNIIASAVIKGKGLNDLVQISSSVKFKGKINNQEVEEVAKDKALIDADKAKKIQKKTTHVKKIENHDKPAEIIRG